MSDFVTIILEINKNVPWSPQLLDLLSEIWRLFLYPNSSLILSCASLSRSLVFQSLRVFTFFTTLDRQTQRQILGAV